MTTDIHPQTTIPTQNAVDLLHDLVAIPSPSTQEAAAVQFLVDWMRGHGYDEAFIDAAGNAVGIIGEGPREIVMLGHIDTFGGDLPTFIREGALYGRGSVDAKGSLCTFAVAAAQADLPADLRVVVVGAVEEEASSSKGARFAATQYQPDFCLIGEPSSWDRLTLGYKGRLLLEWRYDGPLAHSASAEITAPERAFAYWSRVRAHVDALNVEARGIFHRTDATLQHIESGDDGVNGWAGMTVGFRLPPRVDPHTLAAELTNDLEGATVRAYGHEVAHIAAKDSVLSRVMRGAIRAQGGRPRFVHKTGTADMNVVAPHWPCPMLAYGPGDSSLDHTPEEHLNLDEYTRAINVLTDALGRI